MQRLGLTVSQKKMVPPATSVIFLGVEINTVAWTISIPADKLRQISDTVKDWKDKKMCLGVNGSSSDVQIFNQLDIR